MGNRPISITSNKTGGHDIVIATKLTVLRTFVNVDRDLWRFSNDLNFTLEHLDALRVGFFFIIFTKCKFEIYDEAHLFYHQTRVKI